MLYPLRDRVLESALPDEALLILPDNDLMDLAKRYEDECRILLETEVEPDESIKIKCMMESVEFCSRQRARCFAVIGARGQRIDKLFKQADTNAGMIDDSQIPTENRSLN